MLLDDAPALPGPRGKGGLWPRGCLLGLLVALTIPHALAAEPAPPTDPATPAAAAAPAPPSQPPVDIAADRLVHDAATNTLGATGDVEIWQGEDLRLKAGEAIFHLDDQRLEATGDVEIRQGEDIFRTRRAELDINDSRGRMEPLEADMAGPGGHIRAGQARRPDRNTLILKDASFTNCDCDDPPWFLTADQITVDIEENEAVAENATMRLHGIPLAYTPYWRGPVRPVRKSGFLMPSLRLSGSAGLEIDVPYYYNIAPDRDATFTLRPTTRRGVMGKVQYRYLAPDYRGDFEIHGIHDTLEEEFRGILVFNHQQQLGDWRLRAHLEGARSRDYLKDFQQDLVPAATRFLESTVLLDRLWSRRLGFTHMETGMGWTQNLQVPDDNLTVQHLPFLHIHDYRIAPKTGREWWIDNNVGLINFYQLSGHSTQRFDYFPTLNSQFNTGIGSLTTTLGLRETAYLMQGTPPEANSLDNGYNREAALFKARLDTRFQRMYGDVMHTIEPTVQYVANAVSAQHELPNYDSPLRDFAISNLFADNQYAGADRISQGHWLAYGVTSRWLGSWSESGPVMELVRVGVGQRYAPRGHREYHDGHSLSDTVAGVVLNLSENFALMSDARYNFHGDYLRSGNVAAAIRFNKDDIETLGYYKRRPDTEVIALNGQTRLNDNWFWTHNLAYSIQYADLQGWGTGFRYQHDCWSLTVAGGRNLPMATGDHSGNFAAVFLSFQGLGDYGFKP